MKTDKDYVVYTFERDTPEGTTNFKVVYDGFFKTDEDNFLIRDKIISSKDFSGTIYSGRIKSRDIFFNLENAINFYNKL